VDAQGGRKMLEDKPRKLDDVKRRFDELSRIYDEMGETFESKLGQYLRWELIEEHLPKNTNAKILDAGGGTGRTTLPLAKMGYHVTLCDISPGMLDVAREKLSQERLLNKVEVKEADIASLPFADETFDFIVCLAGPLSLADSLKAAKELVRVMKKKGKIIVDAFGRYQAAMRELSKHLDVALKLVKFELNHAYDIHDDWGRVFSPEELKGLFERNGVRVNGVYGRFMELLPKEVRKAKEWDEKPFSQVFEIMMRLAKEPSIIGTAEELILVGEKI
jgi:ubiquinone/menaquinone biosynthesis C-methylase UbiE